MILIVEDDATARSALTILLRAEGHDALAVANGREALETCAALDPDVLIIDYGLPDMTGLEVLEEVGGDAGHRAAVIVTGHVLTLNARRTAEQLGARVLTKPLHLSEILEFVGGARGGLA
jgi:DNA-binding response OmpR family regulator